MSFFVAGTFVSTSTCQLTRCPRLSRRPPAQLLRPAVARQKASARAVREVVAFPARVAVRVTAADRVLRAAPRAGSAVAEAPRARPLRRMR